MNSKSTIAILLTTTFTLASAIAVGIGAVGCSEAKKAPSMGASDNVAPTMKPDRVAATHVGATVLGELTHIERAIKPLIGLSTSAAPAELAALDASGDCRKTQTTNAAQWETRWRCGMDSTESGRKEIEGVERLNYDQMKRTLTYSATFQIRNFDDQEARGNAHTLVTGRKIHVAFRAGSSSTSAIANIRIASSATLKSFDSTRKGSNWTSAIIGTIHRQGASWTMDKGATVTFKGSLYGLDAERNTAYASGDFNLVSETDTTLLGLGDSSCTIGVGTWRMTSVGGGAKFDTTLASSPTTLSESSGGSYSWPAERCEQP
ncbi:hypothetical protein BH10BDE1_BH10BDE1_10060 [soil metagenome]